MLGKCHYLHKRDQKTEIQRDSLNFDGGPQSKAVEKPDPRTPDFSVTIPMDSQPCPHPTHVDARLDGGLCPSALDGDFWLAPQETFHFVGNFLRALLGDLEDKVSPNFLGFRQPRGRQI